MSRREHDAVREARDALLVIAVATPPLLVIAVLFGVASSQLEEFLRWVGGTLLMAVVLLVCLASALLAADRVARHWWNLRPYPLRRMQLIPASLGLGLLFGDQKGATAFIAPVMLATASAASWGGRPSGLWAAAAILAIGLLSFSLPMLQREISARRDFLQAARTV